MATSIRPSSVVSSVRTAFATLDALGAAGIAAIADWILDSSAGSGGRLSVLVLIAVIEALSGAVYEAEASRVLVATSALSNFAARVVVYPCAVIPVWTAAGTWLMSPVITGDAVDTTDV